MCSKRRTNVNVKQRQGPIYSEAVQEYLEAQQRKYELKCKNGNSKHACHYLGMFHETVQNSACDVALAGKYYKIACERNKNGAACLRLGEYFRAGVANFARDSDKAAKAFDRACEYGEGEGCYQAGLAYTPWGFRGEALLTRWRVAEKKFVLGCALNNMQSCQALSAVYRRGEIPAEKRLISVKSSLSNGLGGSGTDGKDNLILLLKNREKLKERCRNASGLGTSVKVQRNVNQLVENFSDNTTVAPMPAGVAMTLGFSCLSGATKNTELCHRTADWMMTTHIDLGSLMYNQNCKLGSVDSCIQLGGIFLQGLPSFPRDHEKAADAFERACNLGSGHGCYQAGMMRTSKEFQCKKVSYAAEKMFVRGCSLNNENSCVQLSWLYRHHSKSGKERSNIFQKYLRRNQFLVYSAGNRCEFGRFEACARLSELCKKKMEQEVA